MKVFSSDTSPRPPVNSIAINVILLGTFNLSESVIFNAIVISLAEPPSHFELKITVPSFTSSVIAVIGSFIFDEMACIIIATASIFVVPTGIEIAMRILFIYKESVPLLLDVPVIAIVATEAEASLATTGKAHISIFGPYKNEHSIIWLSMLPSPYIFASLDTTILFGFNSKSAIIALLGSP